MGGLAAMGKSLTKMVLVLSVWDDQYVQLFLLSFPLHRKRMFQRKERTEKFP